MNMIVCKIFICFLCLYQQLQLLTMLEFWLEFSMFLKKHPRTNLKGFQYQIWTPVKRSGKVAFK